MPSTETRDFALRLLADLPDVPRWIEARAILRSPHAQLFAGPVPADGVVVRLLHDAMSVVAVVGRPPASPLATALDGTTPMTPVVVQPENAAHVGRLLREVGAPDDGREWRPERMLFHTLTAAAALPPLAAGISIRVLADHDAVDHLPSGLRHEITHARAMTAVAAAFIDGVAASFSYPCFTTESLWDVSIDTLEEYRGRGVAAHVVRFMIDHLRRDHLEPTWGALESNTASLRLAARLGFTPVDGNVVFARGPWAYLTRGYTG
jgi:GNAT superfamily N-acetyltransferase